MKGMGAKGEKEGEGREEPKIEIDRSARELERTKEKRRGETKGVGGKGIGCRKEMGWEKVAK